MDNDSKYYYSPLPEPIPIAEQKWPEDVLPLVTTRTITFMHEPYIRDCIEGILMQKTTFPVEVLIHDDASTDKTAQIVQEYAAKFPKLIKAICQKENQYSKYGITPIREALNCLSIGSKYIALCEGDDYWTDPLKLQKQVEFLEANPEYVLCSGGYAVYDQKSGEKGTVVFEPLNVKSDYKGFAYGLEEMKNRWMNKTLTVLYRNVKDYSFMQKYYHSRDIHLFYELIKNGKAFYFTEVFGVYRKHDGGIASSNSLLKNSETRYHIYKEMWEINADEFTRFKFFVSAKDLLLNIIKEPKSKDFAWFRLFKETISISKGLLEKYRLLKSIMFIFQHRFLRTN